MELWIARDKDEAGGELYLYGKQPSIMKNKICWDSKELYYARLPKELFPEITWENSPKKVELKIIE